jgi:hypothetical protein
MRPHRTSVVSRGYLPPLALLATSACDSSATSHPDVVSPPTYCLTASRDADAGPLAPASSTLDFVLDTMTIDPGQDSGGNRLLTASGFDLDDGGTLENCGQGDQPDYVSPLDSDQNDPPCSLNAWGIPRIDDQLPTVADLITQLGFDARQALRARLEDGHVLLALHLVGVDDLFADDDVQLQLLVVRDADNDCGNNFSGTGRFVVDPASYAAGDPTQPLWHTQGKIVRGRFITPTPFDSAAYLPVWDRFEVFSITLAQLRFDVQRDGLRLLRGNYGGRVETADLVDHYAANGPGFTRQQITAVAEAITDLPTNGRGPDSVVQPAEAVGGISIGLGFTAVSAQLLDSTQQPAPGACGSGPVDAGADAPSDASEGGADDASGAADASPPDAPFDASASDASTD